LLEVYNEVKLNRLSLKDKPMLDEFLGVTTRGLSVYAFENIYIWDKLFAIYWTVIENNLCLFFQDKIGCFLYLPPLGPSIKPGVLAKSFRIMDKFNKNKKLSRIENIEGKDILFYRDLGYECRYKSSDYLCLRSELEGLKGDRFKSKRSCINYFTKNYVFEYLDYSGDYKDECLQLYKDWSKSRKLQDTDPVYKGMLGDNFSCLRILLDDYYDLDLIGKVVRINNQIKGFSFGFELNIETFCVLFEIADLSFKGLSQYIFRRFCTGLNKYRYINIMDDSGLQNLKNVKLSYHPARLIPSYILQRKDA
jgi:hypothetical protein